jgi:Flp pilus assembly protein TadG
MRTLASRALFFHRDTRASVQVETTFALLLAVPLLFVVFEVCAFTYTQALLGDAARAGVRYAVVHGSDSTACSGPGSGCSDSSGSNVTSMVQTYAGSLMSQLSTVTVTPSWPDSSSAPPSRVIVTVSYTYSPLFANVAGSIAMQSTAEGRIVY